jgi:DtxR family Mn-dependent transcriptional regulator
VVYHYRRRVRSETAPSEESDLSESEEMYLITIVHLKELGLSEPVPLSRLAQELGVVQVSANQMVKKLELAGLVSYQPYRGVSLTASGLASAARVLRHRRLWESFLIDHLGLSFEDADSLACKMEHITTGLVGRRLSSYLNDPEFTPTGKPIPGNSEDPGFVMHTPISGLEVGSKGTIEFIEGDRRAVQFLALEGIQRGAEVVLLARGSSGSLLVESRGRQISLSPEIGPNIHVQIAGDSLRASSGPIDHAHCVRNGSAR